MQIDFETLDNLRTHHDSWVRLLEELKARQSILSVDRDEEGSDSSYIEHEINALKITLAQASALVEMIRELGPLFRALQKDNDHEL